MSVRKHRQEAPTSVNCMIITISDTRHAETDKSGSLMKKMLEEANHQVVDYQIVKDDYSLIQGTICEAVLNDGIEAILLNGGTGIAKRDVTFEAVSDLLDKEMPGFGELFRYLSYAEDIGSAAILSRAIAGVYNNKAIFSTPGSTGAVKLAMSKLIVPELGHVMREIFKDMNTK
ncbi:molybdenum cofactor biosynthesis protein MoaB [bacterium LRH843]|nr:molybdenum cofactor biosynthesis protein MoaB [bacterium LRH843]